MKTRIGCALAASAAMLLGAAAPAAADDFQCNGVLTGPVPGNVIAPQGSVCVLFNAQVAGNVSAFEGSTLSGDAAEIAGSVNVRGATSASFSQSFITGNYKTTNTGHTSLDGFSTVGGTLEVLAGGGVSVVLSDVVGNLKVERTSGLIASDRTRVRGQAQFFDNGSAGLPASLALTDNIIDGNLQVFRTRGPLPKVVTGNTVGQNVQCFGNDAPFVGGPNTAQQSQGQCF